MEMEYLLYYSQTFQLVQCTCIIFDEIKIAQVFIAVS